MADVFEGDDARRGGAAAGPVLGSHGAGSARIRASALGRSYEDMAGETIATTLDLDSWNPADRLAGQFDRIAREIEDAYRSESQQRREIRAAVFPLLRTRPEAPPNAGVHRAALEDLRTLQQSLLFGGHVQAVDGASAVFRTLPITIVQTAVVMANYLGETGTWGHRVFHRHVRLRPRDGLDGVLALLEGRAAQDADEEGGVSDMLRRGLMMHAELNVLATRATAPWRVGHGHPLPKELLTGTGMPELIELSIPLLRDLLLTHRRFVYVPDGTRDRLLLTIGGALRPLEYAIVQDVREHLGRIIDDGHYGTGQFRHAKAMLDRFKDDVGREIVSGVFRVSEHSPAQVFHAHADHAPEAALVAMADSVLVEARGSPMLLDIAGSACRGLFAPDALLHPALAAQARRADLYGPGPTGP